MVDPSNFVVSLKNVKKSYGGNLVFDGLDLNLTPGNFYALLGRNGSGKSTLIRLLAHREAASSGDGNVLGISLDHDFAELGNKIAYVSEASYMPPGQRVADLMKLYSQIYRGWNQAEAERLAKGFRLDVNKKAGELSRGQLVQMSLILNLAYSPSLILLDEVTAVLDASVRGFLMEELAARVKAGATVLLATNIVTEVQNTANALILIGDKKIKVNASTEKISSEFTKLKKSKNTDHPIFKSDSCIEVGLASNGDPLYLVSKADLGAANAPPEIAASEPITPVEVFIYLTRLRD